MYFASRFTQLISNPGKKPVEIVLLGGIVSVHTHPGAEVILAGEHMTDENLMPWLHETDGAIRIDRQSFFSFIQHVESVNLTVYVPEGNDVSILLRGGQIALSGNFGELRARTDAGQIRADLGRLSVQSRSSLSVFAGEICLDNLENPKGRNYRRELRIPAGRAEMRAKVSLGDIKVKAASNFLPATCN